MKVSTGLSVAIPNYNHAAYLPALLDAVLAQSFSPDEILIVDDGSTDNSVELIQDYMRQDSRFRLIRHEHNLGAIATCQRAYTEVQGEYFCPIAADDFPLPGYFERSMQVLRRYPEAAFCCSYHTTMDGETGEIQPSTLPWSHKDCYFTPREIAGVLQGNFIGGCGSLLRRSAFQETQGICDEFKWHSDWFYLLVMAFRHGCCFVPADLCANRVLRNSYSHAARKDPQAQREVLRTMICSLKSPRYKDLIPLFGISGALQMFGDELIDMFNVYPELWDNESAVLLQKLTFEKMVLGRKQSQFLHANESNIISQARVLHIKGDSQTALQLLGELVGQQSNSSEVYLAISEILRSVNDLQRARVAVETAIRLDNFSARVHLEAGKVMTALGDSQRGAQEFLIAKELDPKCSKP